MSPARASADLLHGFQAFACSRLGPGAGTWIIAFSGGLDSRVLTDLCARFRDEIAHGQALVAAHLNHGLRSGAAVRDQDFCREVCRDLGIPIETAAAEVGALARRRRIGIEEAGRIARHSFFARLSARFSPCTVLLAHHADDQIDTIIMNQRRGAGVFGMAGMAEIRDLRTPHGHFRAARPLLALRRSDLRAYALARNISWQEDASNRDMRFLRNRVRAESAALPDSGREKLLAAAGKLRASLERDTLLAGSYLDRNLQASDGGWFLACAEADPAVWPLVLRELMAAALGIQPTSRAGFSALIRFWPAAAAGKTLTLPRGWRVSRERNGLFFYRSQPSPPPVAREAILPWPPAPRFSLPGIEIAAEVRAVSGPGGIPDGDRADPCIEWIDIERIAPPLLVRERRPGDRFHPLGMSGRSRKLKSFLVDLGLAERHKRQVRILADERGILWVAPHRLDERARLGPGCRTALRLEMRRSGGQCPGQP